MQRDAEWSVGRQAELAHPEGGSAARVRALLGLRKAAANHPLGELRFARGARVDLAGVAPAAQDGGAVAEAPDLVQLVADIEDGGAFARERAKRVEELLDGLRGEHRGGLVHDEQARRLE